MAVSSPVPPARVRPTPAPGPGHRGCRGGWGCRGGRGGRGGRGCRGGRGRRLAGAGLLLALLLPLAGRPAPAEVESAGTIARALGARLQRARLPADRYGVAVLERGPRPRVVFAEGHTLALKPASVAKVLTAAAALDLLGPAHVFRTAVTARGTVGADGVLQGDLVVHGSGDPNLSGRFHDGQPRAVLEDFARAIVAAGIRRVSGTLVLDDGPFDRERVHASWSAGDRARWYGAPVGGLAFNDDCVDVVVRGGDRPGAQAILDLPATSGPWQIENRVSTTLGGRPTVGAVWVEGDTVLRVQGTIGTGGEYAFSHPVPDPLQFFGGAFLRVLADAGIAVEGGMRPARDAEDRQPGALRIAQIGSSLADTLAVMNRRSQNFYASQVFKATGAAYAGEGSWETGERAVTEMLRRRGLDDQGKTRIVDGSGLSLENRTTAATVARVLLELDRDLLRGPILLASLAEPGEDGTLERRLEERGLAGRLHAKTGTLAASGVHALAGVIDGEDGHPGYVFAILLNTSRGGRDLIDDLVREIVRP